MGKNEMVVQNEFAMAPASTTAETSLASVEQSRAVAEVQASLVIAKANPRNEKHSFDMIVNACKRKSLAEKASYAFRRGTNLVTGASIRLAEVLAQQWGNITYGYREIGRGEDFSEVEAFAHDLQTNTRVTRQFQVKHWRDKQGGGVALKQERDKYEMVASMAQRRVRACILEVIPVDVVEAAEQACKATLTEAIGDIKKKSTEIAKAFDSIGVTLEDIENYLQRSIESIVPADIVTLQRIYTSITTGIASKDEFFDKSKSQVSDTEKALEEDPADEKKKALEEKKRKAAETRKKNAEAKKKKEQEQKEAKKDETPPESEDQDDIDSTPSETKEKEKTNAKTDETEVKKQNLMPYFEEINSKTGPGGLKVFWAKNEDKFKKFNEEDYNAVRSIWDERMEYFKTKGI